MKNLLLLISILTLSFPVAQEKYDLYDIIDNVSSNRIERDIKTLVNFGTRHTLSDTISKKEELELLEDGLNLSLKEFQMLVIIV